MAYDHDMHELATRYPEAILGLLEYSPHGPYSVEAIDVKRSEHRIDLVLLPGDERDPTFYVEWQMYPSPDIERGMLAEVSQHCYQTGHYDPVELAIVYPDQATRDRALPAHVGAKGRRAIDFDPRRIVLTDVAPEALLAAGGRALLALPLVGSEERVRQEARDWLERACAHAPDRQGVEDARDLFLKLLAWRLGTIFVEELKGLEGVMEETATGQALLRRGQARECRRAIALVVASRFGAVPEWLPERLEAEADLERLEALLKAAAVVERVDDLQR